MPLTVGLALIYGKFWVYTQTTPMDYTWKQENTWEIKFFDSRITSCREQPWEGFQFRIYICQEIGFRLYINLYAYTQMELPGLTEYVENCTVFDSRINSRV